MYLCNDIPLTVNSNPGMVFPLRDKQDAGSFAHDIAAFISAILDQKELIDRWVDNYYLY